MSTRPPQIALTADTHGRPIAYPGRCRPEAGWFRVGYDEAQVMLSTGAAIETRYVTRTQEG